MGTFFLLIFRLSSFCDDHHTVGPLKDRQIDAKPRIQTVFSSMYFFWGCPQMLDVHATRVVAEMADFVTVRNAAVMKNIRESMRVHRNPLPVTFYEKQLVRTFWIFSAVVLGCP